MDSIANFGPSNGTPWLLVSIRPGSAEPLIGPWALCGPIEECEEMLYVNIFHYSRVYFARKEIRSSRHTRYVLCSDCSRRQRQEPSHAAMCATLSVR